MTLSTLKCGASYIGFYGRQKILTCNNCNNVYHLHCSDEGGQDFDFLFLEGESVHMSNKRKKDRGDYHPFLLLCVLHRTAAE